MRLSRRKFRSIKEWIKFGLAIACVVVFVVFFIFNLWSPIRKPISIVVPRGSSVTGMTNYLYKNNVIKSKELFYFSIRLNGGKIQAGEYDIPRGAGVWTVASMLAKGQIATTSVTIPEGLTVIQIKNMLMNVSYLTGDVDCDKDLPVCDLHDGDVFPDTYRIARGTTRLAVLDLARKKMLDIRKSLDKMIMYSHLKKKNPCFT